MSSATSTPASVAKTPFLAAAALFLAVAALVFALAIKPLGAAELLGLLACAAAAAVFATIPFAIDFARRLDVTRASTITPAVPAAPAIDADQLAAQITAAVETAVDARLAATLPDLAAQITASLNAAEEKRRAELQTARPIDADTVSAPAGAKPRLGRGLLGLIHASGAISAKPADGTSDDDRAAA